MFVKTVAFLDRMLAINDEYSDAFAPEDHSNPAERPFSERRCCATMLHSTRLLYTFP